MVVNGNDNSYYLKHNFNKEYNIAGRIFSDYHNKFDETDKNIVIFGHNTKDGSMFGTLKNVLDKSWQENRDNLEIILITEIGHLLDESVARRLSNSVEFLQVFEEEMQKFTLTEEYNVEYFKIYTNISTPLEYFATAFSAYISHPENLQFYCPKTYDYIDTRVNELISQYQNNDSKRGL